MSNSIGGWINLGNTAIAEIASSYLDWIVIDLEHTTISLSQAEELIRVIELNGSDSYVRISHIDESIIKKVLDAGASGIIAPNIHDPEQVNQLKSFAFYNPMGSRGVGLARAQGYGNKLKKAEYFENIASEIKIFVQIESSQALTNLEEIFSQNIHGYFIGPYDLSSSMGIPGQFNNKKFLEAEKHILDIAKKYNILRGFHVVEPDLPEVQAKLQLGYNNIAFSTDFRILDKTYSSIAGKNIE